MFISIIVHQKIFRGKFESAPNTSFEDPKNTQFLLGLRQKQPFYRMNQVFYRAAALKIVVKLTKKHLQWSPYLSSCKHGYTEHRKHHLENFVNFSEQLFHGTSVSSWLCTVIEQFSC